MRRGRANGQGSVRLIFCDFSGWAGGYVRARRCACSHAALCGEMASGYMRRRMRSVEGGMRGCLTLCNRGVVHRGGLYVDALFGVLCDTARHGFMGVRFTSSVTHG